VSIVAFPGDLRAYSILQKDDSTYITPTFNFKMPELTRYRRLEPEDVKRIRRQKELMKDKLSYDILQILNEQPVLSLEFINKYQDRPQDVLFVCIKNGIKLTNEDLNNLFKGEIPYIGEYDPNIEQDLFNFGLINYNKNTHLI